MCHTVPLLIFFKVIADKQQQKYLPAHSMWLNRVLSDLANTDEQHCLTIDCSGVNKNSPGDIELNLMIQKNRFAILINPVSYTIFS